jgi:plastocyanin
MTRLLTSIAALTAAGALIAGCGSDDDSSSGSSAGGGGGYGSQAPAKTTATTTTDGASSGGRLAIKAVESDGLAFDPTTLKAKAGSVTITMDNPGAGNSQPHAVTVEGPGGTDASSEVVEPGSTSEVTLKVKPGTYTFFCPVGSHRAAGMEGTLTVQ